MKAYAHKHRRDSDGKVREVHRRESLLGAAEDAEEEEADLQKTMMTPRTRKRFERNRSMKDFEIEEEDSSSNESIDSEEEQRSSAGDGTLRRLGSKTPKTSPPPSDNGAEDR